MYVSLRGMLALLTYRNLLSRTSKTRHSTPTHTPHLPHNREHTPTLASRRPPSRLLLLGRHVGEVVIALAVEVVLAVLGLLGLLVLSGRPRRDVVCEDAEKLPVARLAEDDDGGPRLGPAAPRLGREGVEELVEHHLPLGASVAQRLGTLLDLEENLGVRPLGDGGLEELVVRLFPGVEQVEVVPALWVTRAIGARLGGGRGDDSVVQHLG